MAESKKVSKTKQPVTEEPAVIETNITEATIDAAEQEREVINNKRTTPAKAGKRSNKALQEAAEHEAKEERKASGDAESSKPKQHSNPTRSRLERRGKQFRDKAKLVDADKVYSLEDALELARQTSYVKFDATVELHINLGVDPRHADQNIRDNLVLPAGTGKKVRVAVLTDSPAEATSAGAELAGNEEVLSELEKGNLNFDILIATPGLMPKLGKYARVLGPRGLMPNPKSGTVTNDVNRAVAEAKAGRIEYRVDSTGIVHVGIGKVSFEATQLLQNAQAILTSIKNAKPSSVKGNYFKTAHVTSTMGPSIKIDLSTIN